MKRLLRLLSLCAVLLALATPAVSACDAFAAPTMRCAMSAMESMEMAGCHDTSVTSNECCGARSAPDSVAALSNKTAALFSALDAGKRPGAAPPPDTRPALTLLAGARCLNGLGRYTLFSSLLL